MGGLPDLSSLLLWGVPILVFATAIGAFLKTLLKEGTAVLVENLLFFILALAVLSQDQWSGLYPEVELWAQYVFWAVTLVLIKLGFYPGNGVVRRIAARYL